MYNIWFIITALLIISSTKKVECLEKEITVSVEAGKEECFYQDVKKGQVIDIEYQVIDGTHGELDISFQLVEPTGRIIFADFKKSENGHRIEASMDGDYKFCFDNTFSNFNTKTVFFEIIIEGSDDDTWGDDDLDVDDFEGLTPDEIYDIKVQDIQDAIYKVRSNLNKVQHLQENVRNHEARDRNIAEENFFRVNSWSMVQIFVMLSVGFVQVVMLKSLFDNTSKVHKIWKGLGS